MTKENVGIKLRRREFIGGLGANVVLGMTGCLEGADRAAPLPALGEQAIFVSGKFHGDTHSGNLMIGRNDITLMISLTKRKFARVDCTSCRSA